jgi:hypothetical protein
MLRSISEIIGYHMAATDGEIGKAHDFLFDDHEWTVRHLVVDTGKWLPGRKVLIAPEALAGADWEKQWLAVSLTKEKIENSPSVDTDKPVSRQQEIELYRYFAWTPYWGAGMGGLYAQPAAVAVPEQMGKEVQKGDLHLRSVRHVKGYRISAADGAIGHIDDFIVDDETWILRYAVVDTRNWLPGKKVLLSPWWLKDISWADRMASTDLRQDDIKNGPHLDPAMPVNREYEERLYDFHGRPKYWAQ